MIDRVMKRVMNSVMGVSGVMSRGSRLAARCWLLAVGGWRLAVGWWLLLVIWLLASG